MKYEKALAVIAGPYRFYQILWLYTQFPELEWNVLLLPYGEGTQYVDKLHIICDKLGIFKKVYHSEMTGGDSELSEKIFLILKMAFFAFTGQRKKLLKKLVLTQTDGNDYNVVFVGCEYSVIEGAFIGLADEKKIYIFEEGLGDYRPRKKKPSLNINEWISFLVSKMGYFNPFGYFELKNTRLCEKYISLPNALTYQNYKVIKPLFEGTEETSKQFKELLQKAYGAEDILLDDYDVILLTTPMNGYTDSGSRYTELLHKWMVKQYKGKRILIKKHPRDTENYEWTDLKCEFLDAGLPAELFVEYIREQHVILMSASTTLLSLIQRKKKITVIQFEGIGGNYENELLPLLDLLGFNKEDIVCL